MSTYLSYLSCTLLLIFLPLSAKEITIDLTIARTPEEITMGLMGKKEIPPHWGMLFIYDRPIYASFWMFNMETDISLAYITHSGTIVEIHDMQAYPHMMDPNRPVRSLRDIMRYSNYDPRIVFFHKKAVRSKQPISYALEVRRGYFSEQGISVGDTFQYNPSTLKGTIISSPPLN